MLGGSYRALEFLRKLELQDHGRQEAGKRLLRDSSREAAIY